MDVQITLKLLIAGPINVNRVEARTKESDPNFSVTNIYMDNDSFD